MSAQQKPVYELVWISIHDILPSPENGELYRPVTPDDPETLRLADSIRAEGVKEALVITQDNYILSGHRRHMAARMVGLDEVPCRYSDIWHDDPQFVKELATHNLQRVKSRDEVLREAILGVDPKKAHKALSAYRKSKSRIQVETIAIHETRRRNEISPAKHQFLDAVRNVIESLSEFWPLSLRQIHYQLLNSPPLIHSGKATSHYGNNKSSYRALIDLCTRARHESYIDYKVIDDPTRPVTVWEVHRGLQSYYERQIKDLLNGYWRDLQQSQPNHIEIVAEKNTLQGVLSPVAAQFCIPITFGRGQCSTRPLYNIAQRYKQSGKEKLIILAVSDLDPDGDAIAHSLASRLRDDFGIAQVVVVKTALTMRQVGELELPTKYERAKKGSPNFHRYINTYQTASVWELEAVEPRALQKLLTSAIDGVIDKKAFNAEVGQERADAAHNVVVREIVLRTLKEEISKTSS
jgi:hypothetical protein